MHLKPRGQRLAKAAARVTILLFFSGSCRDSSTSLSVQARLSEPGLRVVARLATSLPLPGCQRTLRSPLLVAPISEVQRVRCACAGKDSCAPMSFSVSLLLRGRTTSGVSLAQTPPAAQQGGVLVPIRAAREKSLGEAGQEETESAKRHPARGEPCGVSVYLCQRGKKQAGVRKMRDMIWVLPS